MEDELVPELDDNPGTTRGTKFSDLHNIFITLFWLGAAFDRWPTHRYIRVACLVMEQQACHRVFAPSQRDQDRERIPAPLAVSTVVGFMDFRSLHVV